MKVKLFFTFSIFFSFSLFAQTNSTPLAQKEKEVKAYLTKLRTAHDDSSLLKSNKAFASAFYEALQLKGAFNYSFSSFHKSIGDIYSQDHLVRIISWNVQMTDKSQYYFAFILKRDDHRKEEVTVTQMHRKNQDLSQLTNRTINKNNWYGGLYYKIIDANRGGRDLYTVLAYCTNQKDVSTKMIDILSFRHGIPELGYPLFTTDNRRERPKRIIFQYSHKATMSLRYDAGRKMIIFDHLSPQTASMKGIRAYYVPDFSYDGYAWNGRKWLLKKDIIAINKKKSDVIDLKAYDNQADSVITIKEKGKWINPTDKNAPIGNGQHRAITPEDIQKADKKSKQLQEKNNNTKKDRKYSKYKGHHYTDYGKE